MTSEQQQQISFGIACVTFVIWLGFVAWTVAENVKAKRETRASLARLEDIAKKASPKRGGDGATIISPAPSDS